MVEKEGEDQGDRLTDSRRLVAQGGGRGEGEGQKGKEGEEKEEAR